MVRLVQEKSILMSLNSMECVMVVSREVAIVVQEGSYQFEKHLVLKTIQKTYEKRQEECKFTLSMFGTSSRRRTC